MSPQAFILPADHIDIKKWDDCIKRSANGLIYSITAYLQAMADNWHGVVIDDYRAVMAIPWRMKFSMRYAYMPAFIQQLGLAGDFTEPDLKAVIRTLPDFVRFADIHFNFSNLSATQLPNIHTRTNFVINLAAGYETISNRYRKDLLDNLRRSEADHLSVTEGNIEDAVSLFHSSYASRFSHITPEDFSRFLALCEQFHANGQCIVRQIADPTGIHAIALLLADDKRIYNLMNTSTAKGRKLNANEHLLNEIIKEFSGRPLLFDFEGSDIPGVKAYYGKFGAENQPYFHYRYNGLPWPLKLLKR